MCNYPALAMPPPPIPPQMVSAIRSFRGRGLQLVCFSCALIDYVTLSNGFQGGLAGYERFVWCLAEMRINQGNQYGLGLQLMPKANRVAYSHGGVIGGFRTQFTVWPNEDVAVVVFANAEATQAGSSWITFSVTSGMWKGPHRCFSTCSDATATPGHSPAKISRVGSARSLPVRDGLRRVRDRGHPSV
jgi:hypothetical protein